MKNINFAKYEKDALMMKSFELWGFNKTQKIISCIRDIRYRFDRNVLISLIDMYKHINSSKSRVTSLDYSKAIKYHSWRHYNNVMRGRINKYNQDGVIRFNERFDDLSDAVIVYFASFETKDNIVKFMDDNIPERFINGNIARAFSDISSFINDIKERHFRWISEYYTFSGVKVYDYGDYNNILELKDHNLYDYDRKIYTKDELIRLLYEELKDDARCILPILELGEKVSPYDIYKINVNSIKYLDNIPKDLQEKIIAINPKDIALIKNPDSEIQKKVIDMDIRYSVYINNLDPCLGVKVYTKQGFNEISPIVETNDGFYFEKDDKTIEKSCIPEYICSKLFNENCIDFSYLGYFFLFVDLEIIKLEDYENDLKNIYCSYFRNVNNRYLDLECLNYIDLNEREEYSFILSYFGENLYKVIQTYNGVVLPKPLLVYRDDDGYSFNTEGLIMDRDTFIKELYDNDLHKDIDPDKQIYLDVMRHF